MTLEAGAQIWVPCEVKPGPFSDERLVRVRDNGSEWLGFVPTSRLKEPILEGVTFIGALVVSVLGEKFKARMPGEAVTPGLFEGAVARVRPLGPLEA
ncbi:MAG TPA: hypothetical protein VLT87_18095 [Thermoanaerobaculia bacterium]|nr:hypothetical protein [Thermoanaerobaculia bacterium]